MNTKTIAAIAIVVVLAVASIGAAYAYTASTSSNDNVAGVEYYKLGVKNSTSATISVTAGDYKENFMNDAEFDSETIAGVTTYTPVDGSGTKIAGTVDKDVVTLGNVVLIAFDQDDSAISSTESYVKLKITMETSTSANQRTINSNYGFVAKLGAFAVNDPENAPEDTVATSGTVNGYSVLTPATVDTTTTYTGYLYVPEASVSTGFAVYIGAYVLDNTNSLFDRNMAYGHDIDDPQHVTTDGDNDSKILYDADIKFAIDSTGWFSQA